MGIVGLLLLDLLVLLLMAQGDSEMGLGIASLCEPFCPYSTSSRHLRAQSGHRVLPQLGTHQHRAVLSPGALRECHSAPGLTLQHKGHRHGWQECRGRAAHRGYRREQERTGAVRDPAGSELCSAAPVTADSPRQSPARSSAGVWEVSPGSWCWPRQSALGPGLGCFPPGCTALALLHGPLPLSLSYCLHAWVEPLEKNLSM